MSKTYRRTNKGWKTDWLPEYNLEDIDEETNIFMYRRFVYGLSPRVLERILERKKKAKDWIKKNPHRKRDFGNYWLGNYSKNPSHWNHDFFTVPQRMEVKRLLNIIKKDPEAYDNISFLQTKKGVPYYW